LEGGWEHASIPLGGKKKNSSVKTKKSHRLHHPPRGGREKRATGTTLTKKGTVRIYGEKSDLKRKKTSKVI